MNSPKTRKNQFKLFLALTLIGSITLTNNTIASTPPNILFIIMDDVGIDQMKSFGYGGITPPVMTNIDQIAANGVRFRNNWSMPACTPSRAVFFEGRFPLRTNIKGALGPSDLANSMVSPYEMTTPKLLHQNNYQSGLFGKFHLGLQGNNPYGLAMPASLGWDYYYGWLDETGDPSSIDTTAGGVGASGQYKCGYVPGARNGGADGGACYTPYDNKCINLSTSNTLDPNPPGRVCLSKGGVFDPGGSCKTSPKPPADINFNLLNAHYVSPLVINNINGKVEQVALTDKRARTFRGSGPVDAAIKWIQTRPKNTPWMATVSFATVHTPLQAPPTSLLNNPSIDTNGFNCTQTSADWYVLSNQMIEAMDKEIGRLLVEIGIATRDHLGTLQYKPSLSDTMIVVVGDNGTLGYTVKLPFDGSRAKGTAYQTGVWVPLIVAGPLVNTPNRDVEKMTNIADVYQLFGEIGGINVQKDVTRPFDSVSMLPYLLNPNQPAIRHFNYTEIGLNEQANGTVNGPCQMTSSCTQIPVSKSVCEDNGGTWWGPGAVTPAKPVNYCCQVQQELYNASRSQPATPISILPLSSVAIRNTDYKLVRNNIKDYDANTNSCVDVQNDEFYKVDQNIPLPTLDREGNNRLATGAPPLTDLEQINYSSLLGALTSYQESVVDCQGDGNLDLLVNSLDISNYKTFSRMGNGSSWYDINLDGLTNNSDLSIINQNKGINCQPLRRFNLN